jgi:hypothetical protein
MAKQKHFDGSIGCRVPKAMEVALKDICNTNNRDVSEVVNYLCRIFIEDVDGIRTRFINAHPIAAKDELTKK